MARPPALLSASQRTTLRTFPQINDALLARFYTLGPRELALVRERRQPQNRLGVALLALHVQHLGYFPDADEDIPAGVVAAVAQQLDVDPESYLNYARRDETRREHQLQVADALGYTSLSSARARQEVV